MIMMMTMIMMMIMMVLKIQIAAKGWLTVKCTDKMHQIAVQNAICRMQMYGNIVGHI